MEGGNHSTDPPNDPVVTCSQLSDAMCQLEFQVNVTVRTDKNIIKVAVHAYKEESGTNMCIPPPSGIPSTCNSICWSLYGEWTTTAVTPTPVQMTVAGGSPTATTKPKVILPILIGVLVVGIGIFLAICAIFAVLCRRRRQEQSLHQGVNWDDEGYMGVSERGSPVHRSKAKGQATRVVQFTNRTYDDEIAVGVLGLSHDNRSFVPVVPPQPAMIRKTSDGYVEYNPKTDGVPAQLQEPAGNRGHGQRDRPLPNPVEEDDYVRPYEEVSEIVGAGVEVRANADNNVPRGISDRSRIRAKQQPIPPASSCGQSSGGYVDVDSLGSALQPSSTPQIPQLSSRGQSSDGYVDVDSPGAMQPVSTPEFDQSSSRGQILPASSCGPSSVGYVDVDSPGAMQPVSTPEFAQSSNRGQIHPVSSRGPSFDGYVDVDSPGSPLQPSPVIATTQILSTSSRGQFSDCYVDVDFPESPLQPSPVDANLQSDGTVDGVDVDPSDTSILSRSLHSDPCFLGRSPSSSRDDSDGFEGTDNQVDTSQLNPVSCTPSFPPQDKPSTTDYVDVDFPDSSLQPGEVSLPVAVDSGGPSLNPPDGFTDVDNLDIDKAHQSSSDGSPTAPSHAGPSQADTKPDQAIYFTLEPPTAEHTAEPDEARSSTDNNGNGSFPATSENPATRLPQAGADNPRWLTHDKDNKGGNYSQLDRGPLWKKVSARSGSAERETSAK
ncbi:uncharacterized protein LOC119729847 [Patiria miniata]|uniref:Uncharacterized protein n=1 Tax=Patiria miniata TaxID=46514 RepID=A0A914A3Z9_PATMI|nr:uncharacterized protein LOC119729847 [Patiria miniata]